MEMHPWVEPFSSSSRCRNSRYRYCSRKSFQQGRTRLEEAGLKVSSLCEVASLAGNKVTLVGEE